MKRIISLLAMVFLILSQHSFVKAVEEICEYDDLWTYITYDQYRNTRAIHISEDGKNIIFLADNENWEVIVRKWDVSKEYEKIWTYEVSREFEVSSDLENFKYKARRDWIWYDVYNDIETIAHENSVRISNDITSENLQYRAYILQEENKEFVSYKWEKGQEYDSIAGIHLSNNGDILYRAYNYSEDYTDSTLFLIYNWKQIQAPTNINFISLSTDWTTITYGISDVSQNKTYIIHKWKESKKYDWIWSIQVSDNWEYIWFQAYQDEKEFIVHNWKEWKEYDWIGHFKLSKDWENVTYSALKDSKLYIINNWKEYDYTDELSLEVLDRIGVFPIDTKNKDKEKISLELFGDKDKIYQLDYINIGDNNIYYRASNIGEDSTTSLLYVSKNYKDFIYMATDNWGDYKSTGKYIVYNWIEGKKYNWSFGDFRVSDNWQDIVYLVGDTVVHQLLNWETCESSTKTNLNIRDITPSIKISLQLDKSVSFKKVILSRRNLNRDISTKKYVSQIDRLVENMNDLWKIETILKKLYQIESKLEWKTDKKSIKLINIVNYLTGKMELRLIDKWNISTTTNDTTSKELWNNFTLNQSLSNTQLIYEWNSIYTWSHVSEEVPFVWDEWCETILNEFQKADTSVTDWKQKAWDNLDSNKQKLCMKEFYSKNIGIEKITSVLFNVIEAWYEGSNKMLFNAENQRLYQGLNLGFIIKTLQTNHWVVIQSSSEYACDWKITLLNDWEPKLLFVNNCDVDERYKPDNYRKLQDFTLIGKNTIKAIYIWKDWEEERIIKID